MVMQRKISKTTAITFGAAMATLYAAPELNASIVSVSFNPASLPFGTFASTNVQMATGGNPVIGTFSQWNDNLGKTLKFNTNPGLASWALVSASQTLNPNTFAGEAGNIGLTQNASGTVYIGFRTVTDNVGWFGMNLGGTGGDIVYAAGASSEYGNAGEVVHVGGTDAVPEPSSITGLALLALGAAGLRRRRKS